MNDLSTFAPPRKKGSPKSINPLDSRAHLIVIGAGVFGCWTALHLLRKGFRVELVDMWGPGNSRSSSGGESRLIRSFYGTNKNYFEMAVNSWDQWKSLELESGENFLHHTGVLWLINHDDTVLPQMTSMMDEFGQPYEILKPVDAKEKYKQINFKGIHGVLIEKNAGYLEAKKATIATCSQFVKEGGKFHLGKCTPGKIEERILTSVMFENEEMAADAFVFACGPWLGQIFQGILKKHVTVTRQEAYFFGIPSKESKNFNSMIPWVDWVPGEFYYGIPGKDNRGFKVAFDRRGPEIDPTSEERVPDMDLVKQSRNYLTERFPALKDAPLVESRICQYSNSPDGNFIFDAHPQFQNVWLLGGGSGHGFKHGPAVGSMVCDVLSGKIPLAPDFQIF